MAAFHATYQHQGYVRKSGHQRIERALFDCATLYNAALQERRDAYRMAGRAVTYIDQCKGFVFVRRDMPEWANYDNQIGRGVLRRVDKAFNNFFRRVKQGQKAGFPRFKPAKRYVCLEIVQARPGMVKQVGCKAYVRVKGLPTIQLRLKRDLPSSQNLTDIRIVKRANGLSVDLVYAVEREPLANCEKAIGLDLGVNNRVALADGRMIAPRKIDQAREIQLNQAISRSRKGSNRRHKRVKEFSREMRRNTVRNRNAVHRMTTGVIQEFGHIAIEKLLITNMTRTARGTIDRPGTNVAAKSGLNREIRTQTWGLIRQQLRYKAAWAGREFVEVDPKYTSRECHQCGGQTPQSEYRTYRCGICGGEFDRDTNAALNVQHRAFGRTGAGIPPEPLMGLERYASMAEGHTCV